MAGLQAKQLQSWDVQLCKRFIPAGLGDCLRHPRSRKGLVMRPSPKNLSAHRFLALWLRSSEESKCFLLSAVYNSALTRPRETGWGRVGVGASSLQLWGSPHHCWNRAVGVRNTHIPVRGISHTVRKPNRYWLDLKWVNFGQRSTSVCPWDLRKRGDVVYVSPRGKDSAAYACWGKHQVRDVF